MSQLESFKSFDFDEWRQRYIAWIRDKKLRITDFFRRQDKRGDGMLIRQQFVEGMMASSRSHKEHTVGVGGGGRRAVAPTPQIREKNIFRANVV